MAVVATVPPLAYFVWIWYKGSIDLIDAVVLIGMYCAYLAILYRFPPQDQEQLADAPIAARWAYTRPGAWRVVTIVGLFVLGGARGLTGAPSMAVFRICKRAGAT